MMLVRSEWERLWAKKVTWLCFLMIPVMLLGAAKYHLKHNQEVERIAVDYTYANSFPVLALSEMLMSICNLVLLVLIVLVFAQEYHSGQIRDGNPKIIYVFGGSDCKNNYDSSGKFAIYKCLFYLQLLYWLYFL